MHSKHIGRQTVLFDNPPSIIASASVVGKKEGEGPLKQYFDRLEKIIVANIDKPQEPFKAMYIISPDGDTLNINAELLEAVAQTLPSMEQPATAEPAVAVEANPEK